MQIEGTFRVEVPLVLLGYNQVSDEILDVMTHTHLQLFVTLEPTLSALPPLTDNVCMHIKYMHRIAGDFFALSIRLLLWTGQYYFCG